jgi:hypothetical protein
MGMGIGDWGLGIGPIPNPQSPIPLKFPILLNNYSIIFIEIYIKHFKLNI